MSDQAILEVQRYLPDEEAEPRFQRYEITYKDNWVVLDALNHIKAEVDPTLSFRWSCRMGICGSCGMMVNDEPKLTCETFIRDYDTDTIKVEPLTHFPVVRDLVINMEDFMEKLPRVSPWLIPAEEKSLQSGAYRQTPAQVAHFKRFSMCINCMLCYSACPVYGLDSKFTGPAALALAQRYNLDSRDKGRGDRANEVTAHEGIWECTYVGECTQVCPKDVDPAGAIQMLKLSYALDWAKSLVMPRGGRG
ncbi:MAG TPA: succinate dehydrogenase/fumarate reductase iron-sulfur subunit [Acidimicrobiia bacterium]|nr:succinate dehydrogenase/fumarate reductase iron-sulfur subunit [Acidimicrobiia bacterium]